LKNSIIYIFDFDGVLCDSINECMLTSYNAYKNTQLLYIDEIPEDFRNYFYKYRYYVKPAKEYLILCEAYYKKINLSVSIFNEMKILYKEKMIIFEKHFFSQRKFMQKNKKLWLSYHKMYNHSENFVSQLSSKFYIITNKDYDSVKILSKHFRFNDKIKKIFSKELSNDKKILFQHFFDTVFIEKKETRIIFVDDNEEHLVRLKFFPIELYFAKWGYAKKQRYNSFKEINSLAEIK